MIREGGKTDKDVSVSLGWLPLQKPDAPIRQKLSESHKMTLRTVSLGTAGSLPIQWPEAAL